VGRSDGRKPVRITAMKPVRITTMRPIRSSALIANVRDLWFGHLALANVRCVGTRGGTTPPRTGSPAAVPR
jgi:hypothetical protein